MSQQSEETKINRKYSGLKTRLKNACAADGLRLVQLRYEYLKKNPNTGLPVPELSYELTLRAYEVSIEEFIEAYKQNT
jgi:hypothetical protein